MAIEVLGFSHFAWMAKVGNATVWLSVTDSVSCYFVTTGAFGPSFASWATCFEVGEFQLNFTRLGKVIFQLNATDSETAIKQVQMVQERITQDRRSVKYFVGHGWRS